MSVSAKDVKRLRDMTGAGMMDCKRALQEVDGDFDAAVEYLQKKSIIKGGKKEGRIAAEGLVKFWTNEAGTEAVLLEVNCETDFVSRNDQFQAFVQEAVTAIGTSGITSIDELDQVELHGEAMPQYVLKLTATIGEKLSIRRFERVAVPEGAVGAYAHAGNQIGVLTKVTGRGDAEVAEFARDVAMHIAAMKPGYLSPDDVSEEAAQKQAEIFAARLAEQGKPEHIIPRILEGQMRKWRNENALLEQAFVKNTDLTVGQLTEQLGGIQLESFLRYQVGEGIEKKADNLAEEVAKLAGN